MDESNEVITDQQDDSLLLDVNAVAQLLTCSVRTIHRLRDMGHMPAPIKLGKLIRWRRKEIEEWVEAGCPKIRPNRRR